MKRRKISRRYNKSIFRNTARKVNKKNIVAHINRGGIRL